LMKSRRIIGLASRRAQRWAPRFGSLSHPPAYCSLIRTNSRLVDDVKRLVEGPSDRVLSPQMISGFARRPTVRLAKWNRRGGTEPIQMAGTKVRPMLSIVPCLFRPAGNSFAIDYSRPAILY
jgi:hypothetical protein